VNPDPPLAVAIMLPLLAPAVGLVVVPVTEMVTPAQGSLGAGSPLEQLQILSVTTRNETSHASRFVLLTAEEICLFIDENYSLIRSNEIIMAFSRLFFLGHHLSSEFY
jgi:hypothetical protein